MSRRLFPPDPLRMGLYLAIVFSLIGCTFLVTQAPWVSEAATPTPEIFLPLNPSPTPSGSLLPLTCQVTDLAVYVSEEWGYCFAYPNNFTQDESAATEGVVRFYGPAVEETAGPVRVSFEVTAQPVPENSTLTPLVNAFVATYQNVELSVPVLWESVRLGSEPAEKMEPVPGMLSSRVLMALHGNVLFTLRFHPLDLQVARPDLDALTQTVTSSFAYLPQKTHPPLQLKAVRWFEFGQQISLTYDAVLAPWVEAVTVPAVPVSDQILFSESHPSFAQFRFQGFQGGMAYDLPLLPQENRLAQVTVFRTSEFSGFGDDHPLGFINQRQALIHLLETGVDPAFCGQPLTGEASLPFLPWVNSKQSLCAQPEMIEFANGQGIRYIAYYAQGLSPIMEGQVFYTFQGLTDDGQFYISALFPVETGIFPMEPPPCTRCGEPNYNPFEDWVTQAAGQLDQLNALPEEQFVPSLTVLDRLIESIRIGQ